MLRDLKKQKPFRTSLSKKNASTIKHAKHYLNKYLRDIKSIVSTNPKEVIEAWNEMFGTKYSGMSRALGFRDRVLVVKIYNSSLYALLKQMDQKDLIQRLNQRVPHAKVKEIQLLLG